MFLALLRTRPTSVGSGDLQLALTSKSLVSAGLRTRWNVAWVHTPFTLELIQSPPHPSPLPTSPGQLALTAPQQLVIDYTDPEDPGFTLPAARLLFPLGLELSHGRVW